MNKKNKQGAKTFTDKHYSSYQQKYKGCTTILTTRLLNLWGTIAPHHEPMKHGLTTMVVLNFFYGFKNYRAMWSIQ